MDISLKDDVTVILLLDVTLMDPGTVYVDTCGMTGTIAARRGTLQLLTSSRVGTWTRTENMDGYCKFRRKKKLRSYSRSSVTVNVCDWSQSFLMLFCLFFGRCVGHSLLMSPILYF